MGHPWDLLGAPWLALGTPLGPPWEPPRRPWGATWGENPSGAPGYPEKTGKSPSGLGVLGSWGVAGLRDLRKHRKLRKFPKFYKLRNICIYRSGAPSKPLRSALEAPLRNPEILEILETPNTSVFIGPVCARVRKHRAFLRKRHLLETFEHHCARVRKHRESRQTQNTRQTFPAALHTVRRSLAPPAPCM